MTSIGEFAGMDAQMASAKAGDQELLRYKQRMDSLKQRLGDAPDKEQQLRKACRDFEAVFIGKLWEQMRKTIPKDEGMHSQQEDMYYSMFDQSFSEQMADSGGIGLAGMLYDQLASRLKATSGDTLPGNAEIKPLARNGKPDVKTMAEIAPDTRLHRGPEPETPSEAATPVQSGEVSLEEGADYSSASPARSGDLFDARGGQSGEEGGQSGDLSSAWPGDLDSDLGNDLAAENSGHSGPNPAGLSQTEVDLRLNRLAEEISAQGPRNPGRILANYK